MPTRAALAMIHIAVKDLHLADAVYRDILWDQCRARSSKDLTPQEVTKLLAHFRRLGWEPQARQGPMRFDDMGLRRGMATPAQLRKIEAIWMGVARVPTAAALRVFLKHRFGIDAMRWVRRDQVTGILQALTRMGGAVEGTAAAEGGA